MPKSRAPQALAHLVREQANAVRLYLQYKGYHWNVAGPLFRDLHRLFDEHASEVLATVDPLAERQRILGHAARYTLEDLDRAATIPREAGPPSTTREMLDRLLEAHREVIDGMHDGFRAAEAETDPGTADLFARFVQVHEKMAWFLRELLAQAPVGAEPGTPFVVPTAGWSVGLASHPSSPLPGR